MLFSAIILFVLAGLIYFGLCVHGIRAQISEVGIIRAAKNLKAEDWLHIGCAAALNAALAVTAAKYFS